MAKKLGWTLCLVLLPMTVFAQELSQITDLEFLQNFLSFVGGLKGAGALASVAAGVQLVMKLIQTPFFAKMLPKITSAQKLLMVTGLSVVGGVLALMSTGSTLLQALLHSTTLAALQVFGNQLFKQFVEKKKIEEKKV